MNLRDSARNLARRMHGGIEEWSRRAGKNPTTGRHELAGTGGYKLGLEDAELLTQFAIETRVAVRIGMKVAQFAKTRAILMRGWWKALDGRLYHDTMTTRVLEMMGIKDKERQRKADYRKRKDAEEAAAKNNGDGHGSDPGKDAEVPHLSHGTSGGQNGDGHGSDPGRDDTGTGTGTGTGLLNTPLPPKGGVRADLTPEPYGFGEFWAAYPRKIGKDAARRAFAKRKPDAELLAEMVSAIHVQAQSEQWCKDGHQLSRPGRPA